MNLLQTEPVLLQSLYWITLIAVVVSSASGVLKAGYKRFDLYGVVMIAITTGLGGGSLRDLLLDRPVFWVVDQGYFIASLLSALAIFLVARLRRITADAFLIPDAAGLAAFGVAGTLAALMEGAPWLVASFMGVMTGTMGGVLRDVLSDEPPLVFQSTLYATVCWAGSLLFIFLLEGGMGVTPAAILAGGAIFVARLVAIRYNLTLPRFTHHD
ncbi:MAG: trimeric intracellular cation channel family protein [Gammaproteobacteria bacterium]|nr:MAG: trimeric intracellular cation channel family protein [Gammaproteobacteria bacterium]